MSSSKSRKSIESRRPNISIELPEHSLVPILKKLEDLDTFSKKLKKLLQACENEKSSLKFEIAKLNKKITRIANEKREAESQLYMKPFSGKKRKTRKSKDKKKAGATIPPLTHNERKVKLKEYITKIVRDNLDDDTVLELISNLKLHDKDYGIIILGVLEYLKDRRNGENITINDDYIKEKLEQAKNIQEEGTRNLGGKKSKKKL